MQLKKIMIKPLIGTILLGMAGFAIAEQKAAESPPLENTRQLPYAELFNGNSSNKDLSLDFDYQQPAAGANLLEMVPAVYQLPEKNQEGQWSVSFDVKALNSPQLAGQDAEISIVSDFSTSDSSSKFYVNYGNRRVPISISFEEPNLATASAYNQALSPQVFSTRHESLKLGMSQEFNNNWAVSVNYLSSDFDNNWSDPSLATNNQSHYLPDLPLKSEGLNYNLLQPSYSGLANISSEVDAIEIKVSRKLADKLTMTALYQQIAGDYQLSQPYQYTPALNTHLDAEHLSLFGEYELSDKWSVGASIDYQKDTSLHPTNFEMSFDPLLAGELQKFEMENTTLDIGLQYQSKLDQMGLVIRIDLVNLFGHDLTDTAFGSSNGLDDKGLMPYTFQTPKYIKLSGSINF